MTITPEALQAALRSHGSAAAAYRSLPITRQGVHDRRELRAVVDAWRAERNGPHAVVRLSLPQDVAAALRAAAEASTAQRGGSRPDVSVLARRMVLQALAGRLPRPIGAPVGGVRVGLALGDAMPRLEAKAGGREAALGILRAILSRRWPEKSLDALGTGCYLVFAGERAGEER